MTDTDKNRFVATALGLMTENQQAWDPYLGYYSVESLDFLSPVGADLLLRTLRKRGVSVLIHDNAIVLVWRGLHDGVIRGKTVPVIWREEDHKPALLDAAYRLLKTMEGK